jgi:putative transposase
VDTRDEVVDYVRSFSDRTALPAGKLIGWLGIARSKYYRWAKRYGQVNEHNAWVPWDRWLTPDEKRGSLKDPVDIQALRYASYISQWRYCQILWMAA